MIKSTILVGFSLVAASSSFSLAFLPRSAFKTFQVASSFQEPVWDNPDEPEPDIYEVAEGDMDMSWEKDWVDIDEEAEFERLGREGMRRLDLVHQQLVAEVEKEEIDFSPLMGGWWNISLEDALKAGNFSDTEDISFRADQVPASIRDFELYERPKTKVTLDDSDKDVEI
eukprot:Nitzschia sp. Nitz4//scaffold188_size43225//9858//10474//NITZ4_007344-RA/size43225-snap-gene-0.36-mRNA-1//1//CDS//3329539841//25//frame0